MPTLSNTVVKLMMFACRYESQFENLDKSGGDVRVIGFFQSYKYFHNVRACILKEFTFQPEFQTMAQNFLRDVAEKHQYVQYMYHASVSGN